MYEIGRDQEEGRPEERYPYGYPTPREESSRSSSRQMTQAVEIHNQSAAGMAGVFPGESRMSRLGSGDYFISIPSRTDVRDIVSSLQDSRNSSDGRYLYSNCKPHQVTHTRKSAQESHSRLLLPKQTSLRGQREQSSNLHKQQVKKADPHVSPSTSMDMMLSPRRSDCYLGESHHNEGTSHRSGWSYCNSRNGSSSSVDLSLTGYGDSRYEFEHDQVPRSYYCTAQEQPDGYYQSSAGDPYDCPYESAPRRFMTRDSNNSRQTTRAFESHNRGVSDMTGAVDSSGDAILQWAADNSLYNNSCIDDSLDFLPSMVDSDYSSEISSRVSDCKRKATTPAHSSTPESRSSQLLSQQTSFKVQREQSFKIQKELSLKFAKKLSFSVREGGLPPVRKIEVCPGVYVPVRGADETWKAIEYDFYMPTECLICSLTIFCIQDAKYVICPVCRVVSPMDSSSCGDTMGNASGVGLGFTVDELGKWQAEIEAQSAAAAQTFR